MAAELGALKPGRAAYRRCGKLFFREEPRGLAEVAKGAAPPLKCTAQAYCGVVRLSWRVELRGLTLLLNCISATLPCREAEEGARGSQQAAAEGRRPGSLMVQGNKFKPQPAAAVAADANVAMEQPMVAGVQPVSRDLESKAGSRPLPQHGSLGLALAAGRSCGNGATEGPDFVLHAPHSRAGLNGGARLASAGGGRAKHRLGKGGGKEAAPAACTSAPVLLREAVQGSVRGACAEAAAPARTASANAAAPAQPARPDPGSVAVGAGKAGKRRRQGGHAPASAGPAADSPDPGPEPGGVIAPAGKRRRGAPCLAALAVRSPTGERAQTRPTAQPRGTAKPRPAPAGVSTEVQPPGAAGEAPLSNRILHTRWH